MKYSDEQRIQKIYEYGSKWLVTTPLYNIGEHAYYLSNEYKEEHNEVPWMMISGLRHRLIHDYDGTNWNIIADVVFEELPALMKHLDDLM